MSIRYNVLNLPDTIQFSNGNQITNRYTADGIKHMSTYHTALITVAIPLGSVCQWYRYSRHVYQSNRTIYCGNAEYEIIPTGGASLQRIDFGNGYIRNNTYYYTIMDYLGNISSVWNGTSNVVEQQTTYYPSGLPHRTSTNANLQRYKYNGKELITNHGYDQYDYHARGYYPAIMRFTSVDPLAEKYYSISPYAYCGNNPINRIDPNGMEWEVVGDENAKNTYLQMLYNSTGNNYKIDDNNKLILVGTDENFSGTKSETLINIIQSGIDSKDVYSLNLLGSKGDDKGVFVDSYENKQIDVTDLSTIGKTSTALQGATIGHFLNEVQVGGKFEDAHAPSLNVEGKIFGELAGDQTITTRKDYPTGTPSDGYQNVIFEYNPANKFLLRQGATSTTKGTGQFIGTIEITQTTFILNGKLKSVKKVK